MGQQLRVDLEPDERAKLLHLVNRGTCAARTLTRARILLMADRSPGERQTYQVIGKVLHCHAERISRICRRYVLEGLEAALQERPRSGAPPKITGDIEARLVMLACRDPPDGRTRWTLRLLAEQMIFLGHVDNISNVTVYQRFKKTRSNPGR
ncbi:helix-turn-helix domain-containing protein [Deinococcus sp. SM5_A1]|uniref:helix-turn-helix domain-containing protein n=1 Tax=Deinococcus sp. SM5_A1 TaxID=3379094 RepID=UPI0038591AD6